MCSLVENVTERERDNTENRSFRLFLQEQTHLDYLNAPLNINRLSKERERSGKYKQIFKSKKKKQSHVSLLNKSVRKKMGVVLKLFSICKTATVTMNRHDESAADSCVSLFFLSVFFSVFREERGINS